MMGLGYKGGLRPATFDWAWDQKKNQDALWIGTVNAGMQVGLRAENYSRPLNTNFYCPSPSTCRRPGGTTARAGDREGERRRASPAQARAVV